MKDDKKKGFIVVSSIIILLIILFVFIFNRNTSQKKLDLNKVGFNYQVDDEMVQFLYDRYQSEDGLVYGLIGNNSQGEEYYGYYYRKDKVNFGEFPDILRNFILLDTINYQDRGYDEERRCYLYPLEEFQDLYRKNYGNLDQFEVGVYDDIVPHVYLDEDSLCITDENSSGYTKNLDTCFVNGFSQDDKIIIYERVAFIKENDKTVDFYRDYEMKDKVYSLDRKKADLSFIHNSKVVSNVLLEYQDQFPIYQYNYIKGKDTYYLESIER